MVRRRERVYLPAGFGGLVRYAEEEKEVLRLKPKHVLAIVIGMIVLQVLLRLILG